MSAKEEMSKRDSAFYRFKGKHPQYSFAENCDAFKKRAVAIFGDLSGNTWVSDNDKRWDTICPDRKKRSVSA